MISILENQEQAQISLIHGAAPWKSFSDPPQLIKYFPSIDPP